MICRPLIEDGSFVPAAGTGALVIAGLFTFMPGHIMRAEVIR